MRILGNQKISGKSLKALELITNPQAVTQKPNFGSCAGKFSKICSKIFQKKHVLYSIMSICLQYFVHECLRKHISISKLANVSHGIYIFCKFQYLKSLFHSQNSYLKDLTCGKGKNLIYLKKPTVLYFSVQQKIGTKVAPVASGLYL